MIEQQQEPDHLPEKHMYDKYEESLIDLRSIVHLLYGGYYEPRSERDYRLANQLSVIIELHPELSELEKSLAEKKEQQYNWVQSIKNQVRLNKE